MASSAEHDRSSPSYATPTSKRRNRGGANTPVDRMLYPTPTGNSSNSLRKKPKGKPVPQDLNRADAADRMMFRWKSTGRPWEDIREEYYRLHGSKPAASSLSVRYIKLCENIAANGFKDVSNSFITVMQHLCISSRTYSSLLRRIMLQFSRLTLIRNF